MGLGLLPRARTLEGGSPRPPVPGWQRSHRRRGGAPRPDGENSFDNLAEACDTAIRLLLERMQGYQANIARLERLKSEPL